MLIVLIIGYQLVSYSIILSHIDFHRTPEIQNSSLSLPYASRSDVCSPRSDHKQWHDIIDRHFSESAQEVPSFAVVLTVNHGFYDFFVNWHRHFNDRMAERKYQPLVVIIAEDAVIHKQLKTQPKKDNIIILPGRDFATEHGSVEAEDYESQAYKSLVSSRATHLLNLMCSLGDGGSDGQANDKMREKMVIVYTDVDTVWLKDPFPYLKGMIFGTSNNGIQSTQQQPNYDILAAVDDHDYYKSDKYYCTGYVVIAQTSASFTFLSQWENELQSNPQLNQPIFNTLLRSPSLPKIRHGGLGETEFPSGQSYFDKWAEEGGSAERLKKKKTMVVHNNYIIGHDAKKKRFQEHDLWTQDKQKL